MSEDTETLDLTTDEALLSSLAEHELEELKLEPFSLLRQTIATDLCDRTPGSFFNAVITVWVCTLSPKEALKAHADMDTARIQAFEWAEARGYSLFNYQPLIEAYGRLEKEFAASARAHVKQEASGNGEADPNAGGQPA
jgi:hypothetical protein